MLAFLGLEGLGYQSSELWGQREKTRKGENRDALRYSKLQGSADGHLGGFQGMALVNSTAVNIGAHMSFQSMVFSGFMLGCGIA